MLLFMILYVLVSLVIGGCITYAQWDRVTKFTRLLGDDGTRNDLLFIGGTIGLAISWPRMLWYRVRGCVRRTVRWIRWKRLQKSRGAK